MGARRNSVATPPDKMGRQEQTFEVEADSLEETKKEVNSQIPPSEFTLTFSTRVELPPSFRRRPWAGGWKRRSWRRLRETKNLIRLR